MRKLLITLLFVLPALAYGFGNASDTMPFDIVQATADVYPNVEDDKGRQGMWTIWGRMNPDKGYPEDGKIEEGNYKDGRKNGEWIKFHKDGKTPRLKGVYVDNRPNGAYTKFHANGAKKEEGKFTSGKHTEVFRMWYDTGVMSQEKHFNDDGKEDGEVKYFHPNGQLEFEYTKKDGVTTGEAKRYFPNGDVKEIVMYNNDGSVGSRIEKERVNPAFDAEPVVQESPTNAPDGTAGKTNGKKFKKNGYNKVYNDDQELWMDGDFKSNKLWDGKLYKYDSDGILLKIEVWKKGKYHSDGQLN
ncbi:MAG: antitoxin component YwqK of YwqJK toxin-antitoxin module [Crocinitomix sp.]|jgi:antitoxin component YwqK of YwqJK toxin-antitoxin module